MDFRDYLAADSIVFLRSRSKAGALRELVEGACRTVPGVDPEKAFQAVWEREGVVSSWVGPGIAIPHGRMPGLPRPCVALGRSVKGVEFDSVDGQPVHILVLILGEVAQPDLHLQVLSSAARLLRSESVRARILAARTRKEILELIRDRGRLLGAPAEAATELSRLLLAHAVDLVRETGARAVILHLDALGGPGILEHLVVEVPLILVSQRKSLYEGTAAQHHPIVQIPFPGVDRANQLTVSLLLAVSQDLIKRDDRVVGLFGLPDSGLLDTLTVVDVARELPSLLPAAAGEFLGDVRPEVLERVLQIATALSKEGREGKPVGTVFVVGDHRQVESLSHQLVMNPFKGYSEEERSLLDPSLEETLKEFSTIDGAFLVRGDGVVAAAGAYLKSPRAPSGLPSGLGARHAAAAGITAQTQALAVAVSQSTGRVSLFKGGRLLMSFERPKP
ncbi:MAG: PTS sugar transporter subunit IIA [Spirochaetales bacterium]|nr:PTS sugar transporter subunit IIA [Spirochaetales bacterium]